MFSKIPNITYLSNEPLKNHCSFKIGGNARFFISTHTIDALLDTIHACNQHSIPYKILGGGSNILFDDLGYNGVIIKYDNKVKYFKENKLFASSGCSLAEIIQFCQQNNLSGFEFATGVPALLGGAIINNLGAYEQSISDYVEYITILKNNRIIYLNKDDCNFRYHFSNLQNQNLIILGAIFNMPSLDKEISKQKCIEYFSKRKTSQPLELPNAGSIFRRDKNILPAKLIDDLNLKGLTINQAQVSNKHCGFIVNLGNAKSKDVLRLIEIIKNKIYDNFKVNLSLEIEYLSYL
ncbi:MAG: UDP-N-acetylmuramate dehydrogenase [Clostridia bacterium]